jgi:hypothetical protein
MFLSRIISYQEFRSELAPFGTMMEKITQFPYAFGKLLKKKAIGSFLGYTPLSKIA